MDTVDIGNKPVNLAGGLVVVAGLSFLLLLRQFSSSEWSIQSSIPSQTIAFGKHVCGSDRHLNSFGLHALVTPDILFVLFFFVLCFGSFYSDVLLLCKCVRVRVCDVYVNEIIQHILKINCVDGHVIFMSQTGCVWRSYVCSTMKNKKKNRIKIIKTVCKYVVCVCDNVAMLNRHRSCTLHTACVHGAIGMNWNGGSSSCWLYLNW